jgi:hypothetical protein
MQMLYNTSYLLAFCVVRCVLMIFTPWKEGLWEHSIQPFIHYYSKDNAFHSKVHGRYNERFSSLKRESPVDKKDVYLLC